MWYFVSDLHLGHENQLHRGGRGDYFSSIEEHDKTILNNLLSLPRSSNLFILGDLFFHYNKEKTDKFFQLFANKKIRLHLGVGNHDKPNKWTHKIIQSKFEMKTIKIENQKIVLCHYPLTVWDGSHKNTWNLYGHIHKNDWTDTKAKELGMLNNGKQLNVNLEFHDFKPWGFEEIKEVMNKKSNNWDYIE